MGGFLVLLVVVGGVIAIVVSNLTN